MGAMTLQTRGPLPVEAVWERYADPQRWPDWAPQIRRVDAVGRLRPGLTGRVHSYLPPGIAFKVTAVDARKRTWSWRVQLGPLTLNLEHGVREGNHGGSETWLRLHGPMPLLLAYAPLARYALGRLVR
jgi:polyketide cyclase/dehydrase/lipid transport protein